MNSRAKIGTLAKTDPALLVPYGGEQRAIGELQALGVTLTPEDYRAIRQSLGGGKRGRARARELVPLECPSCEIRLTHFERNGREPYFAATSESSAHGPHCDVIQPALAPETSARLDADRELAAAVAEAIDAATARRAQQDDEAVATALPAQAGVSALAEVSAPADVTARSEDVTTLSDDDLEFTAEGFSGETAQADGTPVLLRARTEQPPASPHTPVFARAPEGALRQRGVERSVEETTFYFISGTPEPSAGAQRLARLGLASPTRSEVSAPAEPRGTLLADARQLLIQGLNRALPTPSVVHYRGQDYAVVAAAELHEFNDGERVAVYGRFSEAEWNDASGRLTLKATPRSVQVWATSAVPRQLLQVESTAALEPPVLAKPVPFLAFGTLRRLGPTCGIPVIRSDSLVLLQALTASLSREPSVALTAAQEDGLTLLPSAVGARARLPGAETSEARDSEPEPLRNSEPEPLRESEPSEPRDSELYELRASEPALYAEDAADAEASASSIADNADALPTSSFRAHTEPAGADARADGLALLPVAPELDGSGLPAPNATHPPARGALSSLRSFASSLRRSKSRGGPA